MSTNERPGVYTSYEVSRSLYGAGGGQTVGLAAAASSGTPGVTVTVTDLAQAVSAFGGGNMVKLVQILLENGAAAVCCCPVSGSAYAAAFSALMAEPELRFVVCDSRDSAVHSALRSAILNGDEKSKYRIGVVESGDSTRAALVSDAQALNCERMVLVSHHCADGVTGGVAAAVCGLLAGESGDSTRAALVSDAQALNCERMVLVSHHCTTGVTGGVAAAVCGLLAGESDPAVPLNGAALQGIDALGANFSDGDLTLLVQGGVLPLETLGGSARVVRGITTRTSTGSVADATWREVNTVRIVDTVIPAVRDALYADFAQAKNTARVRGAIRTRTIIELEDFLRQEIIEGYDNVSVSAAENDPTVCTVSFGFQVAHGLNIIELSAHITV